MYLESYKELIVWQRSMTLVKAVYRLTSSLPSSESFGLYSQMRRAAISIPSNIAEGHKRRSLNEFLRFLYIADGSAAELETQILIAQELFQLKDIKKCEQLLQEVQKMLAVMIRKLIAKR